MDQSRLARCSVVLRLPALGLAGWLGLWIQAVAWPQEAGTVDYFEQHIRPVLLAKCAECHSSDTEASGGLLLDSRAGWQKGGDSGPAIQPGKPEASRLMKAIDYSDPDLQMPPDNPLPAETVNKFKQWIAAGAIDPREETKTLKSKSQALPVERAREHWAYQPITQPKIPAVATSDSDARGAIDAFLQKKLDEMEIPVAPEADPASLLRRLCFDMHGLPPSEDQLRAFLEDENPDAYERAVDRLLASPRFGERMARRWMDVARYAESITLRGFVLPQAWRYREYLIQAFASDKPFDLFVREQIAGDLMPGDDPAVREQQLVATGFLALGNTNLEEQDKDQLEMDYVDEQLEVIGRVFMGQTIGCARCHDHKFDPIPQRDYYALAGILKAAKALEHENVSKWIEQPLPVDEERARRYAAAEKELAALKASEESLTKQTGVKPAGKKGSVAAKSLPGIVIDDGDAVKVGFWKDSSAVGPYVGGGYAHDLHESTAKSITYEPKQIPPGSYEIRISYTAAANRASNATVRVFSADGEKQLTIDQQTAAPISGLWLSLGTYRFEKDGQSFVLLSNEGADGVVIADAVQFLPMEDPATQAIATKDGTSNDKAGKDKAGNDKAGKDKVSKDKDAKDGASSDPASKEEQARIDKQLKTIKAERARLEAILATRPQALTVIEQLPARDLPINIRGNVHNVGPVVPRGFLQCAEFQAQPNFTDQTSGRLEMAQWLSNVQHPLTPRVIANRIWLWVFGQGLVRTVDNFGTTGEKPTDAELLDHLASEFMRYEWSSKQMIRSMLLSAAYRRSSIADERALELDPENKLWSHSLRKRVDVESLRDAMLMFSGEMTEARGQSTLKPGVKEDYRYTHVPQFRSVYQPVLRNSLPELYEAFDFPNPSISIGQRSESVVSPQALALMNSPWILDRSSRATSRVIAESDLLNKAELTTDDWQQVAEQLFFRMLGRMPTEVEKYTVLTLINELESAKADREKMVNRLIHGIWASIDFRYLD